MARRLTAKRSKIAAAVMEDVKQFFEQPQYANCPDDVKGYATWALLPDGPAFHEKPTPITCNAERDHEKYIVSFIPSRLPTGIPNSSLATRGYISIAFYTEGCNAFPFSYQGISSSSRYLCIESTKGPLCTFACFRRLISFLSSRILILINRLNVLSPLSKRGVM